MQNTIPPDDAAGSAAGRDRGVQREVVPRRRTIGLSLGLALLIVTLAWFIGGRQGFGQIGQGGINQSLLPREGQQAPDFVAYDLLGNPVRLSDFRGRPVWLNFWGSWCPPCRSEMPDMQAAYAESLEARGLVILAVSLNEPAIDAALFAARNGVTFTVLSDPNRADTGSAYPIANFPTHILIDKDGIVRDVVLAQISREEIIQRAEKILS